MEIDPPSHATVYLFSPQKPDESFASHILPGSRGYQLTASLSIPTVSPSDSGPYRCYALNERGGSATELQLDVRGGCGGSGLLRFSSNICRNLCCTRRPCEVSAKAFEI